MLKTIEIIGPTASGKSSLCKELQSLEINNEQIFFGVVDVIFIIITKKLILFVKFI